MAYVTDWHPFLTVLLLGVPAVVGVAVVTWAAVQLVAWAEAASRQMHKPDKEQ